jgi:diadenosine tetraphosphate (Ap4A) HIT family hydrolase
MPEPRNQFLNHYSLNQAQLEGVAPWDYLESNFNGIRVFRDRYPVTAGHLLFVPEYDDIDNITEAFRMALVRGTAMVRRGDCDAFNIGINMGSEAGQTVMYPHVHLIPRRAGDVADPVGGVRATIPGQANYRKPDYKNPTDK